MIYKFRLLSDEIEDFRRDIEIGSDATFLDLHKAILESVSYKDDQMTSFFTCSENWEKETEITLEDMSSNSDEDSWIMKDTVISDLVEEEKQHIIYVFDPLAERLFFIELSKITYGETISQARCVKTIGDPPTQTIDFEELIKKSQLPKNDDISDFGEEFYGNDGYNIDEIDPEGYDIEGIADTTPVEDNF